MITLMFHLEPVDDDGVVWWIDSPQVPGFYATAGQLSECRSRAVEALGAEGYDTSQIVEQLVVCDVEPHDEFASSLTVPDQASVSITNGDATTVVRTGLALV